jgi:hypothetical protein
MEVPPIIAKSKSPQMRDFLLRSVCTIFIGIVGFWWPYWYASRIPPQYDSRAGFVFMGTLPFVIAAATWATMSFRRSFRPRYVSFGLLLLVWAPLLLMAGSVILAVLYVASNLLAAH